MFRFCFFAFLLFFVSGCDGDFTAVPKPRAYPRVIYPPKEYKPFDKNYCSFTFEMPKYAVIEQDTTFFNEKAKDECWFNIKVPAFNATIHCSYYPVTSPKRFDELVQDAFSMAQKHNVKANYIEEIPFHRPAARVHGVLFNIDGAAASSCQFFLTDSTAHFLRGALYFKTQTRPDSLAPVIDFMKKDVGHLVETLQWNK